MAATSTVGTSDIATQAVPCPLCRHAEGAVWGRENGFQALKCDACGFVYVSPRPSDDSIDEATQTGEHRHERGSFSVVYKPSVRKLARYRSRLQHVLAGRLGTEPVSWLDIGAGFGELIEALGEVLPAGSSIIGVEPMVAKAEHARGRGLAISSRPLSSIEERFDYISLINIFSHLPDPRAFLSEVAGLLKPGGTLVLVTGNGGDLASAASYPDKLDLPDHLTFAGRQHVTTILEDIGFTMAVVDAHRVDTVPWAVKSVVKRLLGGSAPMVLPHRSPFRDMWYVARKHD